MTIFGCFKFDKGGAIALNGFMKGRVQLASTFDKPFVIRAAPLLNLLKTISGNEVELELTEKTLNVRAESCKADLLLEENFDQGQMIDLNSFPTSIPSSTDLMKGIDLCRYAACPDQVSGALMGVRVMQDLILACDRFRISSYKWKAENITDWKSFTLPVQVIDAMIKHKDKLTNIMLSSNSNSLLLFSDSKEYWIGAKLLTGDYPEESLRKSLELRKEGEWHSVTISIEKKADIQRVIDRQNIAQEGISEFDRKTEIRYSKRQLSLYAVNKNVGTVTELLHTDLKDTPDVEFSFFINPLFLSQAFEETRTIHYSKQHTACAFQTDKFLHLVKTKTNE